MGEDIRPDDLVRSPSGRVPKWVLDEARGIKTEPVPWRAPPTPPARGPRRKGKWRDRVILALVISVVAGYGVYDFTQGTESPQVTKAAGSQTQVPPAARDYPLPGYEEAKDRLLAAPAAGSSTKFRFLLHQMDRVTPVTWSPCRPIHYVVRPDHSPIQGPALLDYAFGLLSQATGLQFINDGSTDEAPAEDRPSYQRKQYGDRWAPVLVVWATADEVPDFGTDVDGEAGAASVYAPDHSLTYISGSVALDARRFAGYVQTPRGIYNAKAVILHELGHLVGLAHVNDQYQVMFRSAVLPTYQAGDLAGLAILGKGPCQPSV
jgi:hypothetical protein